MKRATLWGLAMVAMWLGLALPAGAADLGTAFTYQGRLRLEGLPLNQACDLQFSLWTAAAGGSQVAAASSRRSWTSGPWRLRARRASGRWRCAARPEAAAT